MSEQSLSQVAAAEKADEIWSGINHILQKDQYKITKRDGKYHLVKENDDLELIGSGGFANVYKQKSTGLIIKKLKDDYLTDKGIRSRFKREFEITKSLQDAFGIIKIYKFYEENCSYSMEQAEITLEKYVLNNDLSMESKITCIRQILYIMSEVHKRDIIHRDISANFARNVLRGNYSYVVKETAANILRFVAWDVNRFSAQHMVENIINEGIEPLLEEVIRQ